MDCPRCLDTLLPRYAGDVEIDVCGTCGGWWLDRGELQKLAARGHRMTAEPGAGPGAGTTDPLRPSYAPTTLRCPRDSAELQEVAVAGRLSITIDRCTACRGFWLDAGELDKVTALLGQVADTPGVDLESNINRADLLTPRPGPWDEPAAPQAPQPARAAERPGNPPPQRKSKKNRFFELLGDLVEELID
jgi:Zn-finger nucleic acid-binding protein